MGVVHIFKIVQVVPNRARHHILITEKVAKWLERTKKQKISCDLRIVTKEMEGSSYWVAKLKCLTQRKMSLMFHIAKVILKIKDLFLQQNHLKVNNKTLKAAYVFSSSFIIRLCESKILISIVLIFKKLLTVVFCFHKSCQVIENGFLKSFSLDRFLFYLSFKTTCL